MAPLRGFLDPPPSATPPAVPQVYGFGLAPVGETFTRHRGYPFLAAVVVTRRRALSVVVTHLFSESDACSCLREQALPRYRALGGV